LQLNDQQWRRHQRTCRSLAPALGVKAGGLSRRLQRAMTDFGASQAFARAALQLQEHYGLTFSPSRLRRVTLRHAARWAAQIPPPVRTLPKHGSKWIITSADGTMLPTVETTAAPAGADRRRHRHLRWQEVRLLAAQRQGAVTTRYEACLGDPARYWERAVHACGWGLDSGIHTVGDGAPWISQQSRQLFGRRGRFLLDFYHVSEYLAAANPPGGKLLARQQARLKANDWAGVLRQLQPRIEPPAVPDEQAPVRRALRYLRARTDQLDYQGAIRRQLPIGSGLIESGHRHVLQHRLKLAGAWWRSDHLHHMAQLLTLRANSAWTDFWN
jgi:hypothetical protein